MSLTVEDGSGLAGAEAYASVAYADTRLTSIGNATWAALTTTAKEQALRRATAYMGQRYRARWAGTRLTRAQALDWPRYGVVADGWDISSTVVPPEVANACVDLALRAATEELNADQDRLVIREKIGPLETEYSPGAVPGKQYVAVDQLLAPFMAWGGAFKRLERA